MLGWLWGSWALSSTLQWDASPLGLCQVSRSQPLYSVKQVAFKGDNVCLQQDEMGRTSISAARHLNCNHNPHRKTQHHCDQPIQGKTCQAVRHVLRFLGSLQCYLCCRECEELRQDPRAILSADCGQPTELCILHTQGAPDLVQLGQVLWQDLQVRPQRVDLSLYIVASHAHSENPHRALIGQHPAPAFAPMQKPALLVVIHCCSIQMYIYCSEFDNLMFWTRLFNRLRPHCRVPLFSVSVIWLAGMMCAEPGMWY